MNRNQLKQITRLWDSCSSLGLVKSPTSQRCQDQEQNHDLWANFVHQKSQKSQEWDLEHTWAGGWLEFASSPKTTAPQERQGVLLWCKTQLFLQLFGLFHWMASFRHFRTFLRRAEHKQTHGALHAQYRWIPLPGQIQHINMSQPVPPCSTDNAQPALQTPSHLLEQEAWLPSNKLILETFIFKLLTHCYLVYKEHTAGGRPHVSDIRHKISKFSGKNSVKFDLTCVSCQKEGHWILRWLCQGDAESLSNLTCDCIMKYIVISLPL